MYNITYRWVTSTKHRTFRPSHNESTWKIIVEQIRICFDEMVKTLWERKKMLITSIFFFLHDVIRRQDCLESVKALTFWPRWLLYEQFRIENEDHAKIGIFFSQNIWPSGEQCGSILYAFWVRIHQQFSRTFFVFFSKICKFECNTTSDWLNCTV